MSDKQDIYVAIRTSGVAIPYSAGCTYWQVLEAVYQEYRGAASNWDRPNMLLRNGEVVIQSKLSEHAWNYGQGKYSAVQNAIAKVQENQKPEWL